ncbi:MAG: hypothetical protein HY238_01140 [Acidobacteria bacterium]|nr:hypothetical protein [Acidobacteriota bacterium]
MPKLRRHLLTGSVNLVHPALAMGALQNESPSSGQLRKSPKRINIDRIPEESLRVPEAPVFAMSNPKAICRDLRADCEVNSLLEAISLLVSFPSVTTSSAFLFLEDPLFIDEEILPFQARERAAGAIDHRSRQIHEAHIHLYGGCRFLSRWLLAGGGTDRE